MTTLRGAILAASILAVVIGTLLRQPAVALAGVGGLLAGWLTPGL